MKPFAILRSEKLKDWSTLTKSMGHLFPNVAETIRILLGDTDWVTSWKNEVDAMWLPKLKMGTNHTIAREFILTTSLEFFVEKSKKEREEWVSENIEWLKIRFGAESRW